MTKQTHSPLPWKLDLDNEGNGSFHEWYDITDTHGYILGRVPLSRFQENRTLQEANAAFIVRACNSYYEMREFIKEIAITDVAFKQPRRVEQRAMEIYAKGEPDENND